MGILTNAKIRPGSNIKYKKNKAAIRTMDEFKEEKIKAGFFLEQGTDLINDKLEEYAIIKVYFKE